MYDNEELARILEKNVGYELDSINFYVNNLENLNYKKNKKKVDTLLLESIKHTTKLSKVLLEIQKNKTSKITKKTKALAMKEELGMKEIYNYQLQRTKNAKVRRILKDLIKEETKHEKLVKLLK
jgi:rubrerythrin